MTAVSDAIERLPKYCPTWCAGGPKGHLQALEEGNEVEDASEHMSADLCGLLPDLVNHMARRTDREGGASWDVRLLQSDHGGIMGMTRVELTVQRRAEERYERIELPMTTGEARRLAAQLVYLADQEDLHRDDDFLRR